MSPSDSERTVLRDLARRVAEIAHLPEMPARREAATALNELRSRRPQVYCFAEGAWLECIPPDSLVCEDEVLRGWETRLRMAVYTHDVFRDDQVIDAVFNVPWHIEFSGYGVDVRMDVPDTGARHTYFIHPYTSLSLQSNSQLGAYHWTPPLAERADIDRLRPEQGLVDEVTSRQRLETAEELFGDILTVRRRGNPWKTIGAIHAPAVQLRGMQQLMMDMYDDPAWVHRLMSFLADSHHGVLDELEAGGCLTLNNEAEWIGTGGLGYTTELPGEDFDGDRVRLADIWGGDQAQDLIGISPAMFEEFFLPYTRPIMERYGLSHFGCCEPLNHWIDQLRTIGNLRRVSVSPWADVRACAEGFGDRCVLSCKPSPTAISTGRVDEDAIRRQMVEQFHITRANGCHVEVMMKDLHTVHHEPQRIARWIELVKSAREEVYGE